MRLGTFLSAIVALFIPAVAGAQASGQLVVQARHDSRVWLEGTTSVGGFSCTATEASVLLEIDPRLRIDALPPGATAVRAARVAIPVRGLKCGNRRMEQDLYRAMNADSFPFIVFVLQNARTNGSGAAGSVTVDGRLGVAGAQRPLSTEIRVARGSDGLATARGGMSIRMSDYGVRPPVAMFGLIRVADEITVRFDARIALPDSTVLGDARSVVVVFRSAGHAGSAPPELRAEGN